MVEDAETGEVLELDTMRKSVRVSYAAGVVVRAFAVFRGSLGSHPGWSTVVGRC